MAPPPPAAAELIDDAIAEILLRLPPDEPQCLFRASFVCMSWLRTISDPAFLRRYRRFHRTPPLLGLFFVGNDRVERGISPLFIPTTPASPFPESIISCRPWITIDCRHGLVLLQKMEGGRFIVWDPITGGRREFDPPRIQHMHSSCALLCAVPGCHHCDCRAGPFLVVWVCSDAQGSKAHACVYSSQVGSWGTSVSVPIGVNVFVNLIRGARAGDGVYFMLGAKILKYDLVKHNLSVIDPPPEEYTKGIFIVPTEDGLLGVAGIKGSSLYLWSRKMNAEGVDIWMQYRVIELQTLFPDDKNIDKAILIAFAEGVRVIFMDTCRGVAIIDLNTEQARTVSEYDMHYPAVPFTSFYTPDCACGKLPFPAEMN